jgi:hypothetical protein
VAAGTPETVVLAEMASAAASTVGKMPSEQSAAS